jgi:L-asparagine transporter-like permease
MTIASIFVFRRKHPDWPRPYRCWGYPVVPIIYVLILAAVLTNTIIDQPTKSAVGFVFIVVGACVHCAYAWQRRR